MSAEHTNWPAGREHHRSAPARTCRQATRGFHERAGELVGYRYGKTEKINTGRSPPFPPPLPRSWRKGHIANKWVIGASVRFRTFLGLPNLTKFYQFLPKVCSEEGAKGLEEAVNEGFLATDLFKPCQVRRIVSSHHWRLLPHGALFPEDSGSCDGKSQLRRGPRGPGGQSSEGDSRLEAKDSPFTIHHSLFTCDGS